MSPRRIQWPNLYAVYPRSNGAGKIEPNVRVEAVNSIPNVLLHDIESIAEVFFVT